jgi:hypothetical protein
MEVKISFKLLPLYLGDRASGSHWIGGWVGPTAGLNVVEKRKISLPLPGIEAWPSNQ